jgi:hypothetical protein
MIVLVTTGAVGAMATSRFCTSRTSATKRLWNSEADPVEDNAGELARTRGAGDIDFFGVIATIGESQVDALADWSAA